MPCACAGGLSPARKKDRRLRSVTPVAQGAAKVDICFFYMLMLGAGCSTRSPARLAAGHCAVCVDLSSEDKGESGRRTARTARRFGGQDTYCTDSVLTPIPRPPARGLAPTLASSTAGTRRSTYFRGAQSWCAVVVRQRGPAWPQRSRRPARANQDAMCDVLWRGTPKNTVVIIRASREAQAASARRRITTEWLSDDPGRRHPFDQKNVIIN